MRNLLAGVTAFAVALSIAQVSLGAATPLVPTQTPIKYLVVIDDENVAFDHYFATYPIAANLPGEPKFKALPNTPPVNGIAGVIATQNLNLANPFRLDRSQNFTCDNTNFYMNEQQAYNGGLMDMFVQFTSPINPMGCPPIDNLPMGYYDGNTVTAIWNYVQYYAMSDNSFGTNFGVTVVGHLNAVSGETHGATPADVAGKVINGTVIKNVEAGFDNCASGTLVQMASQNIGDLLTARKVTWGWFYGDFGNVDGVCNPAYNSHYMPFQYYASTSNPNHLPPSSPFLIGTNADQANHQYDLSNFWQGVAVGNIPQVSFLKAMSDSTGHPLTSSPLAEQTFLVNTINALQRTLPWRLKQMAIVITYDDSDGWYDHVMPPIVNQSSDPSQDRLLGVTGLCGNAAPGAYQDRCGYGPRLPLIVISPWSKSNYVDHTVTDQTSVLRFIEDNWNLGRLNDPQSFDKKANSMNSMFNFGGFPLAPTLQLNPSTGQIVGLPPW
ncbi:MAG TPA: alkaline phosphatase family protein [Candidatus Binataceae bacterium]|nr:alkaline phosphatase family protein [Candidatus Binataceae bacterium]